MRELQVHQSGRVAYTGSSKGGKYYAFLNLPPKKSDFMLLTVKKKYFFGIFDLLLQTVFSISYQIIFVFSTYRLYSIY